MDVKPLIPIVFQTVCDLSVNSLVIISSDHPAHFLLVIPGPLLNVLDMEEFVGELGPIVVLVQHLDDHSGSGGQGWRSVV